MNFINLKITLRSLFKNKFYSFTCIGGVAFTFIFIFTLLMFLKILTGNLPPEVNKDKTIEISQISLYNGEKTLIDSVLVTYYNQLKEPEYIARFNRQALRIYNGHTLVFSPIAYTNSDFFNIFKFRYISGRPFNKEEEENRIPVSVITKEYAESYYGRVDVLGEDMEIQGNRFKVIGIIEGPNNISTFGELRIYVPYAFNMYEQQPYHKVYLKAKDKESIFRISEELNLLHRQLFKQNAINSEPSYTTYKSMKENISKALYVSVSALIIVLLLIPAFNIISLNTGKITDQIVEFSIKRAYGASRRSIFYEIFRENTIVTLVGAVIGIALTPIFFSGLTTLINNLSLGNMKLTYAVPINISDVVYLMMGIFFLILIFSILSCFIPALKVMNAIIAEELKGGMNE